MNCPCCGREMGAGVVQSGRWIFFTPRAHKLWFRPDPANSNEVLLSTKNWTRPTCRAYRCAVCQKVVIDYSKS